MELSFISRNPILNTTHALQLSFGIFHKDSHRNRNQKNVRNSDLYVF
jgi:hypothetical protein